MTQQLILQDAVTVLEKLAIDVFKISGRAVLEDNHRLKSKPILVGSDVSCQLRLLKGVAYDVVFGVFVLLDRSLKTLQAERVVGTIKSRL